MASFEKNVGMKEKKVWFENRQNHTFSNKTDLFKEREVKALKSLTMFVFRFETRPILPIIILRVICKSTVLGDGPLTVFRTFGETTIKHTLKKVSFYAAFLRELQNAR